MYARPQLSKEGCWARSLVNLPNSFFHFLSKLKNFIVNLTIRLPFLKVTGTALSACWKKSELREKKKKNKKSAAKWRESGDGQGGALGAQHRAERRLQLEMPSRAAGSVDGGGRVISRGQRSQIYPHRKREKTSPSATAGSQSQADRKDWMGNSE